MAFLPSRHSMVLWVPPEAILWLLGEWKRHDGLVTLPDLQSCADGNGGWFAIPPDARIVSVAYDWNRQSFGFLLEHDSFPETEPGHSFPDLYYREITLHAVAADVRPDSVVQVTRPG